jgi:hypothetical protein
LFAYPAYSNSFGIKPVRLPTCPPQEDFATWATLVADMKAILDFKIT